MLSFKRSLEKKPDGMSGGSTMTSVIRDPDNSNICVSAIWSGNHARGQQSFVHMSVLING